MNIQEITVGTTLWFVSGPLYKKITVRQDSISYIKKHNKGAFKSERALLKQHPEASNLTTLKDANYD